MYELFSNFFFIMPNEIVGDGIKIKLKSNNMELCAKQAYYNYINLNTVYIVYEDKNNINDFMFNLISLYSKKDDINHLINLNGLNFIV
jgi:hypothetical protein